MADLFTHPLTLRGLNILAMGKAYLRFRNPRRRAAGKHHVEFYDRLWRETAAELGAIWHAPKSGFGEIEHTGVRTRIFENVTEIDGPVTLAVLHDKPLTHRLLIAEGLPVPKHAVFSLRDIQPAIDFLDGAGGDCVVKPSAGTGGGRGVTTGVKKRSHLAKAAAAAAIYNDELMIEEQIDGDNYRLLYLDGQLIDAFVRRFPAVVGNGRSTIAQLVDRHNQQRVEAKAGMSQGLLTVDFDLRRTLARQGLSLRSVPENGQRVQVKTAVNENCGSDNSTATHLLCQSIIDDGARAVRALRTRFAGIDIVTKNPRVPLRESGGVILEVNGTPNLYYHYQKKDGGTPVAIPLLKRLLGLDGRHDGMAPRQRPVVPVSREDAHV